MDCPQIVFLCGCILVIAIIGITWKCHNIYSALIIFLLMMIALLIQGNFLVNSTLYPPLLDHYVRPSEKYPVTDSRVVVFVYDYPVSCKVCSGCNRKIEGTDFSTRYDICVYSIYF